MLPQETREPVYMPVATFITSYARRKTITTSQAIRDYTLKTYGNDCYLYSDTDSIHFLADYEIQENEIVLKDKELYNIIEIDEFELGKWKVESTFIRGKYIRAKTYIEEGNDNVLNVTVAGLPKRLAKYVNFDNFGVGLKIGANDNIPEHKMTFRYVPGGVVLDKTDFEIKEKDNIRFYH